MTEILRFIHHQVSALKQEVIDRWAGLDDGSRKRLKMSLLVMEVIGLSLIFRRVVQQRSRSASSPIIVSVGLSALMALIRDGRISRMSFFPDGKLVGLDSGANQLVHSQKVPGSDGALFDIVQKNCPEFDFVAPRPNLVGAAVQLVVPIVFLVVWYKLVQQFMKSASGASDNDNLSAFDRKRKIPKISFSSVVSSSKIELQEIVDYLNDPQRFAGHGARLPRGVLLVGPSGTGKTLMARAVAGEANCAFLSVSASEFVETYVGRGSARIRSLFKQARELAPCVLFIDEMDALGKRQATFAGGTAHDEYVQTMNQLLVELDGIGGHQDGIVVIGATNRFYALDNALLRPGRFDRHVWLHLPVEQERLEILNLNIQQRALRVEAKNGLAKIAKDAVSFSGADLANVVNEAVFFALRRKGNADADATHTIGEADFRKAFEKCKQVVFHRNVSSANSSAAGTPPYDINTALD